jgi:hypothetical protein
MIGDLIRGKMHFKNENNLLTVLDKITENSDYFYRLKNNLGTDLRNVHIVFIFKTES